MFYTVISEDKESYKLLGLSEAKSQLNITHNEFDSKIQVCIDAAISAACSYMGRLLYRSEVVANFRRWKSVFELTKGVAIQVSKIEYYRFGSSELTTVDPSMYKVVPNGMDSQVIFSDSFGFDQLDARPDAVKITFECGYDAYVKVPTQILYGIILYMKDYFVNGNRVDERVSCADNLLLPFRCLR